MEKMWHLKQKNGFSNEYYKISENILVEIKEEFEVDNKIETENVHELKEWVKKQLCYPPEAEDEIFLQLILLHSKFNMEKAKAKIINYFKTIPKYSDILCNLGKLKYSDVENFSTSISLPKLTPKHERVHLMRINPGDEEKFDIQRGVIMTLTTACIALHRDQASQNRFICDFEFFSFFMFLKFTPWLVWKILHVQQNIFSVRISGIDIINAPTFLNKIIALFRPFVKRKLHQRICIHENLESLHKKVPPECLPREYGGTLGHIEDLLDQCDKVIDEEKELFDKFSGFIYQR